MINPYDKWHDRVLIVSPHADDETIGCGGVLAAHGARTHVLVMAMGQADAVVSPQTLGELDRAMTMFGTGTYSVARHDAQNRLDTLPQAQLIGHIDLAIAEFRPTAVFIPYASHHQDHRATYQAALASLRPRDLTVGIRLVALYEYPYASWPAPELPGGKFHLELSAAALEIKLAAFRCYQSHLTQNRWLSEERVKEWARMRGMEVGVPYAEAYWVMRGWL